MKKVFVVCYLKEDVGIEYFNMIRVFSNEEAASAYCAKENAQFNDHRYPFYYEEWTVHDE
jgi:hypothetical protein